MARWARPALLVALVLTGAALAATVGVPQLPRIQAWVAAAGWAGPVLYASIAAVASLTPGPATLLTVGAGVLFGWGLGVPVALAGSLTAAVTSFTLARLLGRAGDLNYGQAMALSTILMVVCAVALLVLERLRTDRTGEF